LTVDDKANFKTSSARISTRQPLRSKTRSSRPFTLDTWTTLVPHPWALFCRVPLNLRHRPSLSLAFGTPVWCAFFVDHRDTDKKGAHELAACLKRRNVSCFAAHDAIEPDEDLQKEVERALQTMDAVRDRQRRLRLRRFGD
jgi:hypothetical protein